MSSGPVESWPGCTSRKRLVSVGALLTCSEVPILRPSHQSETTGLSRSSLCAVCIRSTQAVAPVGNDWFQSEHGVRLVLKPLPFRRTSRKRLVSVGARSRRPRTSAPPDVAPVGNDWSQSEQSEGLQHRLEPRNSHQSFSTGLSRSSTAASGSACFPLAPVGNDWSQWEPDLESHEHPPRRMLYQSETTGLSRSELVLWRGGGDPAPSCTSRQRLVSVGAVRILRLVARYQTRRTAACDRSIS